MSTFGKYVNWGHTAYFSEVAGLGTTEGIDSTGWRSYTTWGTDSNPAVPAGDLYARSGAMGEAIGLAKHLAQTRQPAGTRTRLMYRGFFIDVENQTRNIKVIPKGVTGSEHLGAMRIPVNDTDHYVFALDEYLYSNGLPYAARLKVFFVTPAGETEVDMAGFHPLYLYSTYSGTLDYRWPTGFTYITSGADRLVLVAGISVFDRPNQNGLYAATFGVLYNGALTVAQPGPPPPQAEWTDLSARLRSLGPGPTPGSAVAIFESLNNNLSTKGLVALSISPEGGAAYTEWQPLPPVYGQGIVQYEHLLRRVNVSEYVQVGWEPRHVGERYVDISGATGVISQYMADFYMTKGPLTAKVPLVSIPYELAGSMVHAELYNIPTFMSLERNTVLVAASTLAHEGGWGYSRSSHIITFHDADIEKKIDFGWTVSPGPTLWYGASVSYGPLGDGRFYAALYTVDTDVGGYIDVRLVAFNRDTPLWTLVCPPHGGAPSDGIVVGSGELVIYVHTNVVTGFDSTGEGTINNGYVHTTHLTLYYITDGGPTAVVDFSNTDNSYITAQTMHLSSSSVACVEESVIHYGGGPQSVIDRVNKRVVTFFNFRTGVVVRAEVPTVGTRAQYRTETARVSDTSFIWSVWEASGPELGSTPDALVRGRITHMFSCVVGDELITQEIGVAEYTGFAGAAFVATEVSPLVSAHYQNSGPAAGPATIVFDNGVFQVYSKEATEVSEDPDFLYYSVRPIGGPYDQAVDGFSARTVMRITKDLTYIWPDGLVAAQAPFIQRG